MKYGDSDTFGDPARLCQALGTALSGCGIEAEVSALNSYDLQLNFTGHGAARLLYLLVEGNEPGPEALEDLVRMMVDGVG
ncbi:hypothetical protein [Streptomyces violaceusniger]|uniref:Uncharacterized protein n=1 Tax=Streptomyces violaceusniger (strain Tu 4113) TaxID=653045 RepID=G2PHD7_STRV4|nr:hypothetical protein [Streptomyces violaceusniger]AEM88783.1 hypothetical protein Strvi_0006 [Streptomyces violaceusniger Tu 4113]